MHHHHFAMFGCSHLVGLVLVVITMPLAYRLSRRWRPYRQRVTAVMVTLLLGFELFSPIQSHWLLHAPWQKSLPLNMCDFSRVCLAGFLLGGPPVLAALGLFWGIGGGLVALFSPDLHFDFPAFEFCSFFFSHGIIFYAIMHILAAYDYRPQVNCLQRAVVIGIVGSWMMYVVDLAIGKPANYWYLMSMPSNAIAFRAFLPRPPWHMFSYYLLAFVAFGLIYLPFAFSYLYKSRRSVSNMSGEQVL